MLQNIQFDKALICIAYDLQTQKCRFFIVYVTNMYYCLSSINPKYIHNIERCVNKIVSTHG